LGHRAGERKAANRRNPLHSIGNIRMTAVIEWPMIGSARSAPKFVNASSPG
jgi:hypothetical protein